MNLFVAALLFISLMGCSKDSDDVSPDSEIVGWWHLKAVYEDGKNVTAKYRTINEFIGVDDFDNSYIELEEAGVNFNEEPYFQYFIAGFFEEGPYATHNEGRWEVKGDKLILHGNSGKLEAKITKQNSDELYLEIEDDGTTVEYRFSM